jgi:predicted metal-dependent peptidase
VYGPCTAPQKFNIERHFVPFLQGNQFLAYISRYVRKRATLDIPTAAIAYEPERRELTLWFNPTFMSAQTDARIQGILKHEFYHIVFGHLTGRRREPHKRDNIAKDMAIDYLIWLEAEADAQQSNNKSLVPETYPLPLFAVRPGYFPWQVDPVTRAERNITAEEHAHRACADPTLRGFDPPLGTFDAMPPQPHEVRGYRLAEAIKNAPGNMASEWYFNYLEPFMAEEEAEAAKPGNGPPCSGGQGGGTGGDHKGQPLPGTGAGPGSMDEHDAWEGVPDDLRVKIEGEIRGIVERAARHADESSSGWGNMPTSLQAEIRRAMSNTVDWRSVTRDFVGQTNRAHSRSSVRTRNRRYGLVHPGTVVGHTAHLVVVIDQSGSVGDELLAKFMAELEELTRKVTVTVLPFDAACRVEDAWVWRKGQKVDVDRTKHGGTDFDAPTQVINDNFVEMGWEGAVFLTDGQCSKPKPCLVRRAWVLGPDDKLAWDEHEELVINMGDVGPLHGAWR